MSRSYRIPELSPEEIFAEAVERLEAGEPIGSIVASYPSADPAELTDFLNIVQVAQDIHAAPVPRPSTTRRASAKREFLAAAAELRLQQQAAEQTTPPVRAPQAAPRPATRSSRYVPPQPSLWERMTAAVQGAFSVRALRLAPLIVILALVLFGTSTFVTLAQSALPGDLTYSFKQWIRNQELLLTPPDRRDSVRQAQELELAEDVKKAADRADVNEAVIQAEDTQVFYSRNGRLLKIGALNVMDRYQPDANVELFQDMTVDGDLQPGSMVQLTYQIMPGQSDTVQGISLSVVSPPVITPTPETEDAPAVDTQPREVGCTMSQPEDWVEYSVASGDNLTWIAKRGGTTVEELMRVNCLDSETILIGAKLLVPQTSAETSGAPVTDACVVSAPENWISYQVQVGDNLTALADYANISLDELMRVNCLDTETILIGQKLYLPPADLITP